MAFKLQVNRLGAAMQYRLFIAVTLLAAAVYGAAQAQYAGNYSDTGTMRGRKAWDQRNERRVQAQPEPAPKTLAPVPANATPALQRRNEIVKGYRVAEIKLGSLFGLKPDEIGPRLGLYSGDARTISRARLDEHGVWTTRGLGGSCRNASRPELVIRRYDFSSPQFVFLNDRLAGAQVRGADLPADETIYVECMPGSSDASLLFDTIRLAAWLAGAGRVEARENQGGIL